MLAGIRMASVNRRLRFVKSQTELCGCRRRKPARRLPTAIAVICEPTLAAAMLLKDRKRRLAVACRPPQDRQPILRQPRRGRGIDDRLGIIRRISAGRQPRRLQNRCRKMRQFRNPLPGEAAVGVLVPTLFHRVVDAWRIDPCLARLHLHLRPMDAGLIIAE